MYSDADLRSTLPPVAPREPKARAAYLAELKRLYDAGELHVSFARRPLPDQLLESVIPDSYTQSGP